MVPPQVIPEPAVDDAAAHVVPPSERGQHVEHAQLIARRSIELAKRSGNDEIGETTLELMRAGNHDPATLQHALTLCRSQSRADPADLDLKAAIRLLRRVTTFLGVRPQMFATRQHAPAEDQADDHPEEDRWPTSRPTDRRTRNEASR